MNELGIDPAREQGVMLKKRAEAFKVKPGYIGQKKHGMRVAHGEAGHFPASAVHAQGTADEILSIRETGIQGDFRGEPFRLAHIHRDPVRVFRNFKPPYARSGFHGRIGPGDQAARQGIASHAAYAVAAHFRFAAVAVEHAHPDVRDGRGQNEDETIKIGLSKMIKKNSGGEGQNPLYVALLASFAQAYGIHLSPKVRRNPSIRLVVLDEAFSKMDAEKVASCIDLIRNLGFQAIISATNDKIQNYLENVDKTFVYANPNKKNISIQEFEKCEFDNLLTEE